MSIKNVDFGRVDAESETNLSEYFVDTGVLSRLRAGKKQFIIGRKGSGKTALFQLTSEEKLNRPVIRMDFKDYSWESHKLIREQGLTIENTYTASWKFSLLMAICNYWAENASGELQKKSAKIRTMLYGDENPSLLSLLFSKARRIRRIDGPSMEGVFSTFGAELDDAEGPILASSLSQWSLKIMSFVIKNFSTFPVTITLDRLDEGWDASDDFKFMLVGLLKSAREINMSLMLPNSPSPVIVFLRSDIYNELHFNDKNKIFADIEFIEWNNSKLIEVAVSRISTSLGCRREDAWQKVFSSTEMRQRSSIQSYITSRTMGRPRDLIQFLLHCQEKADSKSNDVVDSNEVYDAEIPYSQFMYNELDDEMKKQISDHEELLQAIKDLSLTKFNFTDWHRTNLKANPQTTEEESRNKLQVLFDYSIVGIPRKGGSERGGGTGGTRFQYVYNDRLLRANFDGLVTVHPSLNKCLGLKEKRRTSFI